MSEWVNYPSTFDALRSVTGQSDFIWSRDLCVGGYSRRPLHPMSLKEESEDSSNFNFVYVEERSKKGK